MKDVINDCNLFIQIDLNWDRKITEHELYEELCTKIKIDTLEDDVRDIYQQLDMKDGGLLNTKNLFELL